MKAIYEKSESTRTKIPKLFGDDLNMEEIKEMFGIETMNVEEAINSPEQLDDVFGKLTKSA